MPENRKIVAVQVKLVERWLCSRGLRNLAMLFLWISLKGFLRGKLWILPNRLPVQGFDCEISGSNDFSAVAGSDVIIVTAGVPHAESPKRNEQVILSINTGIIKDVGENIRGNGSVL